MDRRLVGERTEFGEPGCFSKKKAIHRHQG